MTDPRINHGHWSGVEPDGDVVPLLDALEAAHPEVGWEASGYDIRDEDGARLETCWAILARHSGCWAYMPLPPAEAWHLATLRETVLEVVLRILAQALVDP